MKIKNRGFLGEPEDVILSDGIDFSFGTIWEFIYCVEDYMGVDAATFLEDFMNEIFDKLEECDSDRDELNGYQDDLDDYKDDLPDYQSNHYAIDRSEDDEFWEIECSLRDLWDLLQAMTKKNITSLRGTALKSVANLIKKMQEIDY